MGNADIPVTAANLDTSVALITGGSRGVGKGVAEALSQSGAAVYVTGRTVTETDFSREDSRGTIIPIRCDHRVQSEVELVFERIARDAGRLDILVNNVWGGYENMIEDGEFTWSRPFWEQPHWRWEAMFDAGVRAHFISSQYAARMMIRQAGGLIVNISFWAAQKHTGNVIYGASKAATDKLTTDMADELSEHGVAVVSIYPGLVRTEAVMEAAAFLDLSNSESPQFIGRGVAALAADPACIDRTGKILLAADLAREYGFTDIDGKQPRPLTLDEI